MISGMAMRDCEIMLYEMDKFGIEEANKWLFRLESPSLSGVSNMMVNSEPRT